MLSVIVPAYNEGDRLYDNLLRIDEKLRSFLDSYEIILVNDGSTDGTLEAARKAAEQATSIEIISYGKNKGKGNAIREGFKNASK
jgi:glycosyltransferase involved in cell wall biosynthesis